MDLSLIFQKLGIALGLGLLVGLQRQTMDSRLAGFRTFPLITLLGAVCALLAQTFGGWILAAGLIALAALILIGNIASLKEEHVDPGLTTEAAMLLMFAVGAYLVAGVAVVAVAVGASVAVLLQYKRQMHGIARRLGEEDLTAIMRFALISLVILPVLPNRAFGPYSVLNPRQIWWMVVLIVGISLSGYIVYKFFGERTGTLWGGLLGGLISSTATTVSQAKRTVDAPKKCSLATISILIASTAVLLRVLLEIAVVARSFFLVAAPPLLILLAVFAALSVVFWFRLWRQPDETPVQENPAALKTALLFGLLYAAVLLAVAAVKEHFSSLGLLLVAALSGLTDMDAITLSTAQMVKADRLSATAGWKLIVVAMISNLFFKTLIVAALGHRQLLQKVAPLFGLTAVCGVLVIAFWK